MLADITANDEVHYRSEEAAPKKCNANTKLLSFRYGNVGKLHEDASTGRVARASNLRFGMADLNKTLT